MKRRGGDGQGRCHLEMLDAESTAMPGCVMEADVAITQPRNAVLKFGEVQGCIGEEVKLNKLYKRYSAVGWPKLGCGGCRVTGSRGNVDLC